LVGKASLVKALQVDRSERGQGLVEYALIVSLIAVVAIFALIYLGNTVSVTLSGVGTSM
jgi:Flp pilus assembly pilin Flp